MTEVLVPEVKKRGRKKKNVNEQIVIEEEKQQEVEKVPKKRGRKARGAKLRLIPKTEENVLSTSLNISNVILHLKCSLNDLNEYNNEIMSKMVSDPLIYNPTIPPEITSYNPIVGGLVSYNDNNTFSFYKEDDEIKNEKINDETDKIYEVKNVSLSETSICGTCHCAIKQEENIHLQTKELNMKLKKLKISLYKNNIPIDKVSACFWCSYDFDNSPCYIPKQEINTTIYGYGSFCRPECAVAYLFKENIDDSTKFERYQLLNNIYGKVYDYKRNIKPAPDPHYLLDRFYGQLTIQEYRKLLKTQHMLLVIDKPMTRILPELHDDNEDISYKTGVYKVKRESEREQGPSKSSIIRDKFGLST